MPEPDVTVREVATDLVRGLYIVPNERIGVLPGVLVIHEWWGLNDQIKDEARRLAAEGYAVFAIDLYNGEVATDSGRAGQLAGAVRGNPEASERAMEAALDYLAVQDEVAGDRLATLGWCFGGGMSGIIGSAGDPRLRATVIYYGTPVTDAARLAKMRQPVLGIWGADDQSISVESVRAFESALERQGTDVSFHVYEGAGHAFANPTRGDAYRPEATADAWEKTLDFLAEQLR
jgi:carboxymethylenebutenolidase